MKDKELRKLLLDAGILEYRCYSGDTEIYGICPTKCERKLKGIRPLNYDKDIEYLRNKISDVRIKQIEESIGLIKRIEALEQKKKR